MSTLRLCTVLMAVVACSDPPGFLKTAQPGVVFTFPANGQLDVPIGSRVIVSFSDPVQASAIGTCTATSGAFCLVGPNGPVATTPEVSEDGYTVSYPVGQLEAGAQYDLFVRSELAPEAENLPAGALVSFTTRSTRPRAAIPKLVGLNGGDPMSPDSFRPMFETSTIRLVFSEPLDPRTVALAAGSFELLDSSGGVVPATVFSHGIHVAIDPKDDLSAGSSYTLRIGNQLLDIGGQAAAPGTFMLTPVQSEGGTPIKQVLKTRQSGDPGPERSRSGAKSNEIVLDKPLIGRETSTMLPTSLDAELGDPKALGGPIAFTIRKGQRLRSTGMDIALGGSIPVGLTTGDVWIELLTDAGGRMYRNPHQLATQRPENERAPVYVDLSMDVAVYAEDPAGNAVLTQTVLGVQAVGTALGTGGVLAIETVASMELALLGVTTAPTNLVLELITDASATSAGQADTTPPTLVASYPDQSEEHAVDDAVDLVFSEPIDLERARNGGLRLEDTNAVVVPTVAEIQGAAIVLRPRAPLAYGRIYRVVFNDVADVAGNKLTAPNLSFTTATLVNSDVPMTVTAVHPGVPCALTGATATSPGRCAGGAADDALYGAFTMPADDSIEVAFTQPLRRSSVTLGTACGNGTVRVEEGDAAACTATVPGTLLVRDRMLVFVPDQPWVEGKKYRLVMVSGGNENCDAGELCGPQTAANFDPLAGGTNDDGGGPQLIVPFVGGPRSSGTHMFTTAAPVTDINGSFTRDGSEQVRDENRAGMRIVGVTGGVDEAQFADPDCVPETPEVENCMYLTGAMPTDLGEVSTSCGNTGASSCVPVKLAPEAMYGTSTTMTATVFGIDIDTDTERSVMRVREPTGGPVMGYVVDRSGKPTLVVTLELYMDAPDMSVPASDHDLHSKALSVTLEGPMTFLQDGRIAISLANTADLPIEVEITNFLLTGTVKLLVPARQMKLQLVSPPPRGRAL